MGPRTGGAEPAVAALFDNRANSTSSCRHRAKICGPETIEQPSANYGRGAAGSRAVYKNFLADVRSRILLLFHLSRPLFHTSPRHSDEKMKFALHSIFASCRRLF